jgi:hypothetical protein
MLSSDEWPKRPVVPAAAGGVNGPIGISIKDFQMADDLKQRQPQDGKKINVTESWEVEYWSKVFKITPEELKTAVSANGPSVVAVRKYLESVGRS